MFQTQWVLWQNEETMKIISLKSLCYELQLPAFSPFQKVPQAPSSTEQLKLGIVIKGKFGLKDV